MWNAGQEQSDEKRAFFAWVYHCKIDWRAAMHLSQTEGHFLREWLPQSHYILHRTVAVLLSDRNRRYNAQSQLVVPLSRRLHCQLDFSDNIC